MKSTIAPKLLDALNSVSTEKISTLAFNGNMAARYYLTYRRQIAEEAAGLHCIRIVSGKEGMDKLWESIHSLTAIISKIPVIGKTPLGRQLDIAELENLCHENHPQNPSC